MTSLDILGHVVLFVHLANLLMNTYLVTRRVRDPNPITFLELFLYFEKKFDSNIDMIKSLTKEEIKNAQREIRNKEIINKLSKPDKFENEKKDEENKL